MVDRLPVFVALQSLTLWIGPHCQAKHFINSLKVTPNLITLNFRHVLWQQDEDAANREEFEQLLRELLPWSTPSESESMKTVLTRTFPRCQQIGFHFWMPRDSDIHFRRGLRRRMERRLKDRLDESGADISELLRIEWLDEEYNPVRYNTTNGKPPWTIERSWQNKEPETEASDCESEKSNHDDSDEYDSDGNLVIREWTEADERSYRREMLEECGIYGDEDGYSY